jgi:hypothetical protein
MASSPRQDELEITTHMTLSRFLVAAAACVVIAGTCPTGAEAQEIPSPAYLTYLTP